MSENEMCNPGQVLSSCTLFPEMRGVRLTYARVFLSLIPSLNILWHYVKGTLYSARK